MCHNGDELHPSPLPLYGMVWIQHDVLPSLAAGSDVVLPRYCSTQPPLHPALHARYVHQSCHSRESGVADFRLGAREVSLDTGCVNDSVTYSSPCGPLCKNADVVLRRFEAKLRRLIDALMKGSGVKPTFIGLRDMCIHFRANDGTETIVFLDLASGRNGPNPPTATFTWADPVMCDDIYDVVLEPRTEEYIEVCCGDKGKYGSGPQRGTYSHCSERELAAHLLQPVIARPHEELVAVDFSVEVRLIQTTPVKWTPRVGDPRVS